MQAIQTKFLPVTVTKPNRIKAFCPAGSLIMGCDNIEWGSHDERTHRTVALALAAKLGWDTMPMMGGELQNGAKVFVFIPTQITNKLNQIEVFEFKQAIAKHYK